MSFLDKLQRAWRTTQSMVCVGLDPDEARIPACVAGTHRYFDFCRAIVDATAPYVCAYKPQAAHFAAVGREAELASLLAYIREAYPHHVTILDAKRGDIGSTAEYYAMEAYRRYDADAVTVNPYLGYESIAPYLAYPERGIVVLCRTSNPDSDWLQKAQVCGEPVYLSIARKVAQWNCNDQFMLVTGATYPQELGAIRRLVGDLPLLVPGIGAQGGDLAAVLGNGLDHAGQGLLLSSSRGIIYAGSGEDFAEHAANAASALQESIRSFLDK